MTATRFQNFTCLGTLLLFALVSANTRNIPVRDVPQEFLENAIRFLNAQTSTQRFYQTGNLISAQLLQSKEPQRLYRLTLDLETLCEGSEPCPREVCIIDVQQSQGSFQGHPESIQCKHSEGPKNEPIIADDDVTSNSSTSRLDFEVQKSSEQNDRPFFAVKAPNNRWCAGCPYELNPALPGLAAFADDVVDSIDNSGISDFKHKVIGIVRVMRSVPPGSVLVRYELLMEIGETNCLRSSLIERSKCSLPQLNAPIKLCLVTIDERFWDVPKSRKIVKNNCTESTDMVNELNVSNFDEIGVHEEDEPRTTRTEVYEYDQVAQEGKLSTFSTPAESRFPGIGKEEKDGETLVRAVTYKSGLEFTDKLREFDDLLKDFDIPVKEASTTPDTRIPVIEEEIQAVILPRKEEINDGDIAIRNKRLPGPLSPYLIRKLAQIVVDILDEDDGDNHKRVVLDVLEQSKEIINNTVFYRLLIMVGNTHCAEKEALKPDCMASLVGQAETCRVLLEIQDQTRPLARPRIESSDCHNKNNPENVHNSGNLRRKRQLAGGINKHDINDPEIQNYAKQALFKVSETFEGENEPFLVEVTEASVQIVAGKLYRIKVKLGTSDCAKGVKENCNLKSDSEIKMCNVEVWSRPWLDKDGPEIKVDCNEEKSERRKRGLKGVDYSRKMLEQAELIKVERQFQQFQEDFKKSYSTEEERQRRFEVFRYNMKKAKELNELQDGTAKYGATIFADLTSEEFRKYHTGLKLKPESENKIPMPMAKIPEIDLPKEFDWRHFNVVTPVKNQGQCGSCWAFSVTGNIESQYAIKHGKLLSLSEQELVDCDKLDEGCNGGLPSTAYEAIEQLGGLELENDYPYDAEDEKCNFNKNLAKVKISSGLNITSNETLMAQWLVKNGPISIGINANAMQLYAGGISHPYKFLCNPKNLDHGVLIVGFGVHNYPLFKKSIPFWIIKNSWGPRWGEQGYYRIYRGAGVCGVNQMATSAVVV